MSAPVVMIMAKAPVPGQVKTRLASTVGPDFAARLAAAALLDTLDACEQAFGIGRCHLALAGDLQAVQDDELLARLDRWTVHHQRGDGLAERIANAHRDVHAVAGAPVVQVGMDTPHVSPDVLSHVSDVVGGGVPVLGLAEDGGWWVLATAAPGLVDGLEQVPMSTPGTGRATWDLLHSQDAGVVEAPTMRDVDVVADAVHVAALAPATRFARSWLAGHDVRAGSAT
ncbi:TIGR04282 family arsenosugar biosynthesis glycosyltransferase [Sanguibacter antarcticus]|uniref:Glycosyltransferase A (GT-A) superfamily protein (DUF2064 family) n=1 Tax=Sanguibacter antarcticus TaxID=372484 RepID=A0A2A9E618_9MICO|nr:DUF2064 domain-containing protein [Sanguibacter antarcticus]PFG34283.1 hypothetical protein ATL42_2189 [Sanguibacter antarcticus]